MTILRIKELAEARGLNITTLARQAGLAYTTTHALWHGSCTQFSMKTLDRVALALGVCVGDLFGGAPDPTLAHPPEQCSARAPRGAGVEDTTDRGG